MNEKMKRLLSGVLCLMLAFSLIQPGLASAEVAYSCGKTAHTHGPGCYTEEEQTETVQVLDCPVLEAAPADGEAVTKWVHTHGPECFDAENNKLCPLEEVEEHEHNEECYVIHETPQCGLEESEGHTHGDDCYKELTCEKEVVILHEHDESCYPAVEPAVEGEPADDEEPEPECGLDVVREHIHGDDCYTTQEKTVKVEKLICTLAEHTHDDTCVKQEEKKDEKKEEPEGPSAYETYLKTLEACSDRAQVIDRTSGTYESDWDALLEELETLSEALSADCEAGKITVEQRDELLAKVDEIGNLYWGTAEPIVPADEAGAFAYKPHTGGPSKSNTATAAAENVVLRLFDYTEEINDNGKAVLGFLDQLTGVVDDKKTAGYDDTPDYYHYDCQEFGEDIKNGTPAVSIPTMNPALGTDGYPSVKSVLLMTKTTGEGENTVTTRVYAGSNPTLPGTGNNTKVSNSSLAYLFEPSDGTGKTYYPVKNDGSGTGLFRKVGDSYVYDSAFNHAEYNKSAQNFTLYDFALRPYGGRLENRAQGHFLPFNYDLSKALQITKDDGSWITDTTTDNREFWRDVNLWSVYSDDDTKGNGEFAYKNKEQIGETNAARPSMEQADNVWVLSNDYNASTGIDHLPNYWYGMSAEINFNITKINDQNMPMPATENAMIFKFLGDDDVFVYVDGVLILDLGGNNCDVGEINFTTGAITKNGAPDGTIENKMRAVKGDDYSYTDAFSLYSTHKLNFYYLERGTGTGNCRLTFNMEPIPENSLAIRKDVTTEDGDAVLGEDLEYKFRVVKPGGALYIPEGTPYTVDGSSTDASGNAYKVGANGIFTLKAGQTARFTEMISLAGESKDFSYVVQEILSDHTDKIDSVKIGDQTVDVVDGVASSPTYQGDTAVSVSFKNIAKVGSLSITKKVLKNGAENPSSQESFKIAVKLNGKPVPTGTAYAAGKTVAEGGIITLKHGETATISNIIAGTEYRVEELAESKAGYVVTYQDREGGTTTDLHDMIIAQETANVTVTNAYKTITPTITLTKNVANPNDQEHTYTFDWWAEGSYNKETKAFTGGIQQTPGISVTVAANAESAVSSPINLKTVSTTDFATNTDAKTYYYKFVEKTDSNAGKTVNYDPAVYIVELTVSMEDGELSSEQKIYKDGEECEKVEFTNTLLGALNITKTLAEGTSTTQTFKMVVKKGDELLKNKAYTIKNGDTIISTNTTGEAGVVEITAGQTAVIEGLTVGDTYTVEEVEGYGYGPTYTPEAQTITITEGSVAFSVENAELETSLDLVITKELKNPNPTYNKEHGPYEIKLTDVTDRVNKVDNNISVTKPTANPITTVSATADLDDGTRSTGTIEDKDGKAEVTYALKYKGSQLNGKAEEFFYYQVEESEIKAPTMVITDTNQYVVEVKLSHTSENELKAEVSNVYKLVEDTTSANKYLGVKQTVADLTKPVTFSNTLLGALYVQKDAPAGCTDTFTINVQIKSNLITSGMKYMVDGVEATADKDGVIDLAVELKGGEHALIGRIPCGAEFTVTEDEKTNYGFTPEYTFTVDGKAATANTVPALTNGTYSVFAKVENKEQKVSVTIDGTKYLPNTNGEDHSFQFALTEVDAAGKPLALGEKQTKTVTFKDQDEPFSFTLNYQTADLAGATAANGEKAQKFYYQITEATADSLAYDTDQSVYTVEVTLTGKLGQLTAAITDVKQDGTSLGEKGEIAFNNTLLGSLTVKKVIAGPDTDANFKFRLSAKCDGNFPAEKNGVATTFTIKDGLADFWLRQDDVITIYGLPHGLEVEIFEYDTEHPTYYKIDSHRTRYGKTAKTEVDAAGTTVRYTNYTSDGLLPQTGQLKWPVLALGVLGLGFLGFGMLSKKRKKNGK